jgi:uncharacterized protein (AIM24 family)
MPSYKLINEKLLEVTLANEEVYSKRGAMIAYTGQVNFARSFLTGRGIQEVAMRTATSEGWELMLARGTGAVCYAHRGAHVTIIPLQGEMLYVESDSLLAFDRRLTTGTMFMGNQGAIQGVVRGAMTGQGLFTTTLTGRGEVAILSEGDAIGLDVTPEKPVFVDPNAYLGHRGQLSSQLVTDIGWKNLIGQSSGESFQLKFSGVGAIYIQASERGML